MDVLLGYRFARMRTGPPQLGVFVDPGLVFAQENGGPIPPQLVSERLCSVKLSSTNPRPTSSAASSRGPAGARCQPSAETMSRIRVGVTKILITGMSGTGKSTLLAELARRGHRVVDLDFGWRIEVPTADGSDTEQLWREDRVAALLAEDDGVPLFVSECASNQGRFYDRFDALALLSVPFDVLLDRLATRETNSFGKDPSDRDRILRDLTEVEPRLRASATVEIDAMKPLYQVADTVETMALGAGGSTPVFPNGSAR